MGSPDGTTLAEKIARERALALQALERDAQASELRDRANGLGNVLREAAEDDRLWHELDLPRPAARDLGDEQRLQLRTALSIDWPPLLDRLGYVPPPPSEVVAYELVSELRRAIDGVPGADVSGAREHLLGLAHELIGLSGSAAPSTSRLRRLLRRGVRVAGPVLILVGATAAVLGLLHVLPVGPALAAAAQWGPIAEAIKAAGEVPLLGKVAEDLAMGALVDGAKRLVARVLGRGRKEPEAEDEDPVERAALAALAQPDHAELGALVESWRLVGGLAQLPAPEPEQEVLVWSLSEDAVDESPPEAAANRAALARHALDATRELQQTQMEALFLLWNAAIGAGWATPHVHELLEAYYGRLDALRSAIADGSGIDVDAAVAALHDVFAVNSELRRALAPLYGKAS